MKNRYDGLLRQFNQEIINLCSYNPILFYECAKLIESRYTDGMRIIEIGSGEGDSALPLLEETNIPLDLLDVSAEMNHVASEKLSKYTERINFICADGNEYLLRAKPYDIIYAAWTIHNFTQEAKKQIFNTIYSNLKPGGVFILLDKVYPSGDPEALFEHQNNRYRRFLPADAAAAIIEHELQDMRDEYRMDEGDLLQSLNEIGFSKLELIDRVERDVILLAIKE